MKSADSNRDKELYARWRRLSCERLWTEEVPRFNEAAPGERLASVALVRAVGVVFSEGGTAAQRDEVKQWLRTLLKDPAEKIRRYSMAALPKVGAGEVDEAALLALLRTTDNERERKYLSETLEKIGGTATLAELERGVGIAPRAELKVKASVARDASPGAIRMDAMLTEIADLRVNLRGRRGLEDFVREEVIKCPQTRGRFRVAEVLPGLVALVPLAPFSLGDIHSLRCFGNVGIVLGTADTADGEEEIERLAAIIASPRSRRIFETLTEGTARYRLDFVGRGHQRGAVRRIATRAYAMCPGILNDSRNAPWTVAIHSDGNRAAVELIPRLVPDPRFYYRQDDVPAASHPPLAACMARLAGEADEEIVWDPFCGSGLELIERAQLGGVRAIFGTDLSAAAVSIAEKNFAAARLGTIRSRFACLDFRDHGRVAGLGRGEVSLVITNPPLGKRVPVPDLRGLIDDLFAASAFVLRPGGRLVFANPFRVDRPHPAFRLDSRRVVDFGGFDCLVEKHIKTGR